MSTDPAPWFHAEHRPERHEGEPPTVDLIRRGPPLTGNPDLDCWADRGCVYGLSLAEAIALRDSITAAIDAARPKASVCGVCGGAHATSERQHTYADLTRDDGDMF